MNRPSSQDGGIGRYTLPRHTTKRRTITNLNKKQPDLPENQTVCNSNNQEVKEEALAGMAQWIECWLVN